MRKSIKVFISNIRLWHRNPKIIIPFIVALVCVFMLCQRISLFIRDNGFTVNIFEVFIAIFNDQYSILITSLLVIVILFDAPTTDPSTPYYLIRSGSRKWLIGQMIFLAFVSTVCVTFILVSSVLSVADRVYLSDDWSSFAFSISYSKADEIINIDRFVKTMNFSSPSMTALSMLILIFLYYLTIALTEMLFNMWHMSRKGGLAAVLFSFYGLMMTPSTIAGIFRLDEMKMYKANVAMGWLSPLNHATFDMHSFGYDRLPQLWQSCIIFCLLILILVLSSFRVLRDYEYDFSYRR